MTQTNNKSLHAAYLVALFCWIGAFCFGQVGYGQAAAAKPMTLDKSEAKIEVLVGDKEQTVATVQYQGRADHKAVTAERSFVIGSSDELTKVLKGYGYTSPTVNFQENLVVHVHSREKQCFQLTVGAILFEEGKVANTVNTEMMRGGSETEGKLAFTLVIVPRSLTK